MKPVYGLFSIKTWDGLNENILETITFETKKKKKLDYDYQMRSTWLLGEVFWRYVSGFKKK